MVSTRTSPAGMTLFKNFICRTNELLMLSFSVAVEGGEIRQMRRICLNLSVRSCGEGPRVGPATDEMIHRGGELELD